MIPAAFDYVRPGSVAEALDLLATADDGTKVIAGGHSLLPLLKMRLASADRLIDISRLRELHGVDAWGDGLAIGAAATYADVLGSTWRIRAARCWPRRSRTSATSRCATGARSVARWRTRIRPRTCRRWCWPWTRSWCSARRVASGRWPRTGSSTALSRRTSTGRAAHTDPHPGAPSRRRHGLPPADAARVRLLAGWRGGGRGHVRGQVSHVRVGITGVGDHAYRATAVEAGAGRHGRRPSGHWCCLAHAAEGQEVGSDIHADREYRTAMASVYVRRALEAAIARAGSSQPDSPDRPPRRRTAAEAARRRHNLAACAMMAAR